MCMIVIISCFVSINSIFLLSRSNLRWELNIDALDYLLGIVHQTTLLLSETSLFDYLVEDDTQQSPVFFVCFFVFWFFFARQNKSSRI